MTYEEMVQSAVARIAAGETPEPHEARALSAAYERAHRGETALLVAAGAVLLSGLEGDPRLSPAWEKLGAAFNVATGAT